MLLSETGTEVKWFVVCGCNASIAAVELGKFDSTIHCCVVNRTRNGRMKKFLLALLSTHVALSGTLTMRRIVLVCKLLMSARRQ